jgi:hypothetical protein
VQNAGEEALPEFEYEGKEQIQLDKLVHSILIESSRTKSLIPECLTKRVCESIGLECNEESFFNLMGAMVEMTLNSTLEDLKSLGEVSKNKKGSVLSTAEVRKALEEQGIYMTPSKIIPEMGINEDDHTSYNFQKH